MAEEGRRYTRSLSQLKLYSRCGELYKLERILGKEMPRRPAAWTIMGIAVHEAVMDWEKGGRNPEASLAELFLPIYDAVAKKEWERQPDPDLWILPPRTKTVTTSINNYRTRGYDQMVTYEEYCREAPWNISHIEQEFEITLGEITVRGAIDRILHWEAEDSYTLEDLKSGSVEGEDDIRQLGFYAMVAREQFGIPVNEGRYWFTKLNRGSEFVNLEKFDRKFWEDQFAALDRGISESVFLASPGKQCGICSVKPWCSTQGWLAPGEPLK